MGKWKLLQLAPVLFAFAGCAHRNPAPDVVIPSQWEIDSVVREAMAGTGARGLAVAVIDNGRVVRRATYGERNASGAPLEADTIMYGASLTKVVFTYLVMQLVDEGKLDLDTPIERYLQRPLPEYTGSEIEDRYARWSDLAGDDRWRRITPRMLLTHSPGFANFGFLEPDGKLKFHFDPGTRYSYSGDGFILLQFVLEQGLGLDIGQEMSRRIFEPLHMSRTSMDWREDFASNKADGWKLDGGTEPHDERSAPRAAGSMDTTIADFARFASAFVMGRGLSSSSRREMVEPLLPITSASQFPVLQEDVPAGLRRRDLAAGLGLIIFDGPQGRSFIRGGHNDSTGNMWICIESKRRCAILFSNDVRAEAAFPYLMSRLIGETGAPWNWILPGLDYWRPQ